MKIIVFLLNLVFMYITAASQTVIEITPTFQGEVLVLDKNYFHPQLHDSLSISKFQFYLGQIQLYSGHKIIANEEKYFLIDATSAIPKITIKLDVDLIVDNISFSVGIDSITNVTTTMLDDLDPIHGMYWTWQSGYIGFKLEGNSPTCPTRNHAFQYHLGGYLPGQNAHEIISLRTSHQDNIIKIQLPVDDFFDDLKLSETNQIMSPSEQSTSLFQKMVKRIHLSR